MKRVSVYTNGKVSVDVICGSLSEYQEKRKDQRQEQPTKDEAMYKGREGSSG